MSRARPECCPPVLLAAALLGAWELYVDLGAWTPLCCRPPRWPSALWGNAGLFWSNLTVTAEEVVLGILLALALGFALAVLIHFSPPCAARSIPLAVGSQAVPIAVIAPLLVFWWGFGVFPKLVVIVLICFFPVVVTTVDGLAASTPISSSCCARSTPRAGRRSASPSCRRRCRRRSAARASR